MSNFSSSLVGLSILSGTNGFAAFGAGNFNFETRAVREAKEAFDTPATIPPWKQAQPSMSLSARVSEIRALPSIIDTNVAEGQKLTSDVAATFTTYKALDRLRALAESAVAGPTSSVRETLQGVFSEGLTDLQAFLGGAAGDNLSVSFDQPSSSAKSVPISTTGAIGETLGGGVAEARDGPLIALTGTEQFEVTIKGLTSTDVISVDLAGGPQPPTLDSVSDAINSAIAAVPKLNADGTTQLDADGNPVSKWMVEFNPDKSTGSWGFKVLNPGLEEVSIDQVGGEDALMIATGMTGLDAASSAQVMRIVNPAGVSTRETLSNISGLDPLETERAELNAKDYSAIEGVEAPPTDRFATTSASAMVTDDEGSSYIVGTTEGDLGSHRLTGSKDLFLTKVDSEGNVLWQRELGAAGSSEGAAISIGQNGEIVVAGTVAGMFDGDNADGDMLVARFNARGEELSSTLVRTLGTDTATAVAVGNDGSIYVGGKTSSGGGDAFVARLDSDGALRERRRIDSGGSDTLNALAIGQGGEVLALTREGTTTKLRSLDAASLASDLGEFVLGEADARAIAVADDGTVAIGGATRTALNGGQVNAISGGRDGFVARVSSDLSGANISYVGTGADDQIDSVSFMNGSLYAGGRTTGDLGGSRSGSTDGFVSRLDAGSGAVVSNQQFGLALHKAEPVKISAATGGSTVLGALGLRRGVITDQNSLKLTAQTSLRAGDQFSIRVDGGTAKKITIEADETLATLSEKVSKITGAQATVTTPTDDGLRSLSITAKAGSNIELIPGDAGRDALDKLGLPAAQLVAPPAYDEDAPKVTPGGSYGLALTHALDLSTKDGAALALKRVNSAISMIQTAYRSLYWDSTKAATVNGDFGGGGASPYLTSQISRYQDALMRIAPLASSSGGGGGMFGM